MLIERGQREPASAEARHGGQQTQEVRASDSAFQRGVAAQAEGEVRVGRLLPKGEVEPARVDLGDGVEVVGVG